MSKPIELKVGDKVRRNYDGKLYTVTEISPASVYRIEREGYHATVGRSGIRFVSSGSSTKPKVGDVIRPKKKGSNHYTHVSSIETYTGKCVKVESHDSTCAIIVGSEKFWFKWSEIEIKPKTAEVAIDVDVNSIESMEKALKAIDAQRDMIADKLLAKKKEAREKANQKEISKMISRVKSQCSSVQIRNGGNFAGKGLYLSSFYNWTIETDNEGQLVLVPTLP